ncbi:MAG: EVE domain-containing protein [Novosphingobium sp.]|uniref:EVE domain-containing protein n=1 Tax=Novosphingobium sp. TaxID=1874826 RepID=UPI001DCE1EDC|nr:EVE domain-containing protein [Novosphingobium sp.]MCB2056332.1 EVE domain-containing protein [Novosphingobium sp.]MCP5386820.1 EVE domain-containing protein [Novosphingobium sp.]
MTKIKSFWLMKSEPDVYSWDDLVAEGEGTWDGVRNYTARNNLRAMEPGDLAFFYHSNIGIEIIGIAEITASNIPDPTDQTGRWSAVRLKPLRKLKRAVTLKEIKVDPELASMELLTKFRLSVSRVNPDEWDHILKLAER